MFGFSDLIHLVSGFRGCNTAKKIRWERNFYAQECTERQELPDTGSFLATVDHNNKQTQHQQQRMLAVSSATHVAEMYRYFMSGRNVQIFLLNREIGACLSQDCDLLHCWMCASIDIFESPSLNLVGV